MAAHQRIAAALAIAAALSAACAGPRGGPDLAPSTGAAPAPAAGQLAAIRSWTRFVLARHAPASRLFVESYFMRGLIATAEVLEAPARSAADHALADSALARARAFADSLVHTQDARGYWKLGYDSGWVADMAAAVALFGSVEPHAAAARLPAYEECAAKYIRGLERDGLILDSGGVGLGWPLDETAPAGARAWRSDMGWSDSEYLVATALAGIEVNAWLYHRTQAETYRTRAWRALDVTLARLKPDGSFPTVGPQEGPLQVAFYVHEGWIAADAWLQDPARTGRLCTASAVHAGVLTAAQQPDGTWTSSKAGDSARTDGLVNFLLWREAHCGSEPDVHRAVERSRRFLVQPHRWGEFNVLVAGQPVEELSEIRRAFLGRPLAAVVRGRPVL